MTLAEPRGAEEIWTPMQVDILGVKGLHQKDDRGYCTECRPDPDHRVKVRWPCQKARLAQHASLLAAEVARLEGELAKAKEAVARCCFGSGHAAQRRPGHEGGGRW